MDRAASLLSYIRRSPGSRSVGYRSELTEISGGYDTKIYRFALDGMTSLPRQELVVRLFPGINDGRRATKEATIQRALSAQGLPVPDVHFVCIDQAVLGTPFIVMDHVEGETLLQVEEPEASRLMGDAHALLHDCETDEVISALARKDIDDVYFLNLIEKIEQSARYVPWGGEVLRWLKRHQPIEASVSLCHGDFHKLNIMQDHGDVSGILDWSNFGVYEPAFDVANTQISFSIVAKHLTAAGDFEPVNLDEVLTRYRSAYATRRTLDTTNLEYYLVLRSAMMLVLAALGFARVFRHPLIVSDLCELICEITNLKLIPEEVLQDVKNGQII